MTKTLILLFHPDLAHSKANAALAAAAAKLPAVELVDMQAIYPHGIDLSKDGEREARRLLECDRIVLQLRSEIANNIDRNPATNFDVAAILETCAHYTHGLAELVQEMQVVEQNSLEIQHAIDLLQRTLPDALQAL